MPGVNFHEFRWVVVNNSGGKDSQTALLVVVQEADRQAYPRSRIVVSHQCLGEMEWPGTMDLARRQAEFYGLRFETTKYRTADGVELSLLDMVAKRGKWPDNKNRYCTSDCKRDPGRRVITKLYGEARGNVLNVFGFRSEESPARAKKAVKAYNKRASSGRREVWDWLPIHDWTETQVWESIRSSGVPYHPAYDKGMPRLSCCFCIFAPRAALIISGRANPELLDKYVAVEKQIGHTFQNGKPIADIKQAIMNGEQPASVGGKWNM